jgi:hypothetical protein
VPVLVTISVFFSFLEEEPDVEVLWTNIKLNVKLTGLKLSK